jgi:GT2 family glycosyltransferase
VSDGTERLRLSVVIATHDNQPVLARCLDAWRRLGPATGVELLVIEDGCRDGTVEYLREIQTTWNTDRGPALRVFHEENVHELMCTNRGFREARAPLILSWHDDMFLQGRWMVPELLAVFDAYPDLGLVSLSRGLDLFPCAEPVRTFEDSVDWRRLRSTIGVAPWNWVALAEVDAVMRPWVVRRACLDRVGVLDEVFRPTEWDEADLCYRIRAAGWKVATHGYERDGVYRHLLSTTYARTPSEQRQAKILRNALIFHERWDTVVEAEHMRPRKRWRRRMGIRGVLGTLRAVAWQLLPRRGPGAGG